MATLLITYNLNNHDDDYAKLFEAIRALGDTWHNAKALDSVWFVKTAATPTAARDAMKKAMDRDDNCFVVDITNAGRQGWMPKDLWAWMGS